MSVVIVGGNECMRGRYRDLCRSYNCKARVYAKMDDGLTDIGRPDLLVLFTSTVSHTMIRRALSSAKGRDVRVVRSHVASVSALRSILEEHVPKA
ncbi:MAG: DUF2325 domain-containing protein [Oscillospiraceae bacterium]|nr:DUF2325 domain-containing protein [Oscillospiraceae bacterium]